MKYIFLFLIFMVGSFVEYGWQDAYAETPTVYKGSTEQFRAVLQSEQKGSFLERLKQKGELIYGPLYAYGNNQELLVSFGLEMSESLRWGFSETESGGKIYLAAGINRIVGPWYDELSEGFDQFEGFRNFSKNIAASRWPQMGEAGKYRVGFGSCLREDLDPKQKIFNHVHKQAPHAFMLIGDTVYNDLPSSFTDTTRMKLDVKYNRQLAVRRFKDFYTSVPLYAVWDDHDFWINNADRKMVSSEERQWSRDLFTSIFPNGVYGEQEQGIYFKWSLGDVDFLMLDTRWFRIKKKKQMLGKQQNEWLREQLLASQATFKVLVSSVQWHEKGGKDSWGGYLAERNAIFEFIFENKINGVFLLSGDAHHGAAYQLEPDLKNSGYPLIEFTSSSMAVEPKKKKLVKTKEITQLLNVRGKHNFGMLEFDTTAEVPYVDLKLFAGSKSKLANWEDGQQYYRIFSHDLSMTHLSSETPILIEASSQNPSEDTHQETPVSSLQSEKQTNPVQTVLKKPNPPSSRISDPGAPPTYKMTEIDQPELGTECPEAPIFTVERLRQKALSDAQIRQVCYGKQAN